MYARARVPSRNASPPPSRASTDCTFSNSAHELAQIIAVCSEKLAGSYPETAMLLEIARLDLVARLNGISEEELQQVACGTLNAAE